MSYVWYDTMIAREERSIGNYVESMGWQHHGFAASMGDKQDSVQHDVRYFGEVHVCTADSGLQRAKFYYILLSQ